MFKITGFDGSLYTQISRTCLSASLRPSRDFSVISHGYPTCRVISTTPLCDNSTYHPLPHNFVAQKVTRDK